MAKWVVTEVEEEAAETEEKGSRAFSRSFLPIEETLDPDGYLWVMLFQT